MKRLKKRWYAFTLIGTIFALFVMVAYNYAVFNSNIIQNMEDISASNLAQVREELEGYINDSVNMVETTAVAVEYMMEQGASAQEIERLLSYESKRYIEDIDENFTGIYGLVNDEYIDGIGWEPDKDYNPKTRDWYVVATQANGEPAIVSPYVDAQTDTVMLSISKMLSDGNSVISLDFAMENIQKITENIKLNNLGYGIVIDKNGLIVAHSTIEEKGKNYLDENSQLKNLVKQIQSQEKACFQIDIITIKVYNSL